MRAEMQQKRKKCPGLNYLPTTAEYTETENRLTVFTGEFPSDLMSENDPIVCNQTLTKEDMAFYTLHSRHLFNSKQVGIPLLSVIKSNQEKHSYLD